jgi:hypothetical protein
MRRIYDGYTSAIPVILYEIMIIIIGETAIIISAYCNDEELILDNYGDECNMD